MEETKECLRRTVEGIEQPETIRGARRGMERHGMDKGFAEEKLRRTEQQIF